LDGSALRRVTNGGAFAGSPSWSPDGTKLVFYEAALPEVDLIKSPLSPRATTQLASVDVRTASVKP
jgi:Tol biopolymer transport system component